MSEQILTLLKFGLLALLYLFFARTLWAVWSEVRGPASARGAVPASSSGAKSKNRTATPAKARQSAGAALPTPNRSDVDGSSGGDSIGGDSIGGDNGGIPPTPVVGGSPQAVPPKAVPAKAVPSKTVASKSGASKTGAKAPDLPATELPEGKLVVIEPEAQNGMSWPLGRELTIGRAPGCGIPVDDTFVSQVHARVWAAGGSWMVEDLGSTNGTVFNEGALTEPRVMQMGDQIRVGSTVLELQ